jgi:2,4-dienoyl-CoA reductase-like NADH-dependent reductase (Old Yellow Enzyme family)
MAYSTKAVRPAALWFFRLNIAILSLNKIPPFVTSGSNPMSMWRPKERIRYDPRPGQWPTAAEALASRLFNPIRVGRLNLAQRTWVPAMVPWRSDEHGNVTEGVLQWYERFAQGRPGAIVVEATGIRDIPSGPLLRISDDRYVAGLRELASTVRRASGGATRLFIQLIDFLQIRRRPMPETFFRRYLRLTDRHRAAFVQDPPISDDDLREKLLALGPQGWTSVLDPRELEALDMGYRERIDDMDLAHIRDLPKALPDQFAAAAKRAQQAGFDGVELHFAHAYTMASFLSGRNGRRDGYGGSLDARIRLPLEVHQAVRRQVSNAFVVGCRYLADDCLAGGTSVEDAQWFAARFAQAGFDFLSLSRGGKFEDAMQPKVNSAAYPYTGRSGYECMPSYYSDAQGPFGRNVEPAAAVRRAVRKVGCATPIVVVGGIHGFAQAEHLLAAEQADIIGFARQALADPDWFEKVRLGYGSDVRMCLYTNYCEALDQKHVQVTCELWDREGLDESGIALSHDGKRRLLPPRWQPRNDA